jgi:poly-gamma-glutamate synthesis protein (capsule biosynthesis protein)
VLARFSFDGGELVDTELVPVSLGRERDRSRRGDPALATAEHGRSILERLSTLSAPYGTVIEVEERDGRVVGRPTHAAG